MKIVVTALVVFTTSLGWAAKPPLKAKSITLKRLVEIAMKKGEAMTLDSSRADKLGYPTPPPAMDFIAGDLTKDSQLSSIIILDPKTKAPKEILFSSTTVTQWTGEDPLEIDGYSFRSDLKGRLISALRAHGKVGAVTHDKVSTSSQIKKHFDSVKSTVLTFPELLSEAQ